MAADGSRVFVCCFLTGYTAWQMVNCCKTDQLSRTVNKAPKLAQRGPAFLRAARPSAHNRFRLPSAATVGIIVSSPVTADQSLVNREPWNALHALPPPATLLSPPKYFLCRSIVRIILNLYQTNFVRLSRRIFLTTILIQFMIYVRLSAVAGPEVERSDSHTLLVPPPCGLSGRKGRFGDRSSPTHS